MYPVLFKSQYVTFYSYGVCVAAAVALAWLLTFFLARRASYPAAQAADLLFLVFISGIAGARLFYVLLHPDEYAGRWHAVFFLQEGGLVWYGGALAATVTGFFYAKALGLRAAAWADFFSPLIPLSHALGRVGCFLNGCCFGRDGYPVQLYESGLLAALSAFLFMRFFRRKKEGEVFCFYLAGYGAIRFMLEFLRGDQSVFAGLTLPQWMSLFFMAAAFMLYGRLSYARTDRPDR